MIYENEIRYVLCLLKCAVSDEIPPNPPENLDWEVIFKIGKSHKIYSTLFFGLQKLSPSLYSSIPHFEDYLASLSPKPVASLTALITLTF